MICLKKLIWNPNEDPLQKLIHNIFIDIVQTMQTWSIFMKLRSEKSYMFWRQVCENHMIAKIIKYNWFIA